MSDILLDQLIQEVTSLRSRVNALETAEVIPSRLQASDGDPNPALSADADGVVRTVLNIQPGDMTNTGLDYRAVTLADEVTWPLARDGGYCVGLIVIYCTTETASCLLLVDLSGGPVIVAQTGGNYVLTNTDGKHCIFVFEGVLYLKNRRDANRSYRIGYLTLG